ncbi:hypothetical protein J6524_35875 [Bradyrhizobium sp. WSM 1738]|uniref:hypothetical protein n=1 Tax=Bradyrhizobium hereditatis TaxID=2821405 RepID=UPI001CE35531|nr:hypothetical protein [Bradyrhizobium hereditatis]MCA6120174.1 hypothetical protein [Bradyrhizobium hereditatis]
MDSVEHHATDRQDEGEQESRLATRTKAFSFRGHSARFSLIRCVTPWRCAAIWSAISLPNLL